MGMYNIILYNLSSVLHQRIWVYMRIKVVLKHLKLTALCGSTEEKNAINTRTCIYPEICWRDHWNAFRSALHIFIYASWKQHQQKNKNKSTYIDKAAVHIGKMPWNGQAIGRVKERRKRIWLAIFICGVPVHPYSVNVVVWVCAVRMCTLFFECSASCTSANHLKPSSSLLLLLPLLCELLLEHEHHIRTRTRTQLSLSKFRFTNTMNILCIITNINAPRNNV